jgi:AcrR family transcriptional regulator
VLGAALELFADQGFDRTTVRAVARRAGVDPALIYHYFGSKDGLLEAALSPPPGLEALLAGVQADPGRVGEELVRRLLHLWDTEPRMRDHMLAMLRTGLSHQAAADVMRERQRYVASAAVGHAVAEDDRELRLSLVGSHVSGLLLSRYVLRAQPIAAATVEELAVSVGPVLQHYLTGPLSR